MSDGFVQVRGLRLHYREWSGPGGGVEAATAPVVLVHGLGSSGRIWDRVAPLVAGRHRVLALDQRGHGESDQPDDGYEFASVTADLHAFLDATAVAEPAALVGHSWGAGVVLELVARHPDRATCGVLVDGGYGSMGEFWSWEETLERLTPPDVDAMLWTDLLARVRSGGLPADDQQAHDLFRSLFHVEDDGRIRRRFRIPNHLKVLRAIWESRPAELLARVERPILMLLARRDEDDPDFVALKVRAMERALAIQPLVRVRWFEDTIHDVPLQRPQELAAELLAFAAQAESAART